MKKRALTKKPRYHASILILDFPTSRTLHSVRFSSVAQSCPTLCNPMDCSTPDLPVYHQLPEFTQTHVHWVGDAIHPWMEEPGRLQSMGPLRVGHDLSDFPFTFHFHALEKEMVAHSSVLAWRIPGMGKPGGPPWLESKLTFSSPVQCVQ